MAKFSLNRAIPPTFFVTMKPGPEKKPSRVQVKAEEEISQKINGLKELVKGNQRLKHCPDLTEP